MCGSCFLFHSAILCLLIGAFNPFTFKVIIDRYLFIAIFCTCVPPSLTIFLPFLKADPLPSLAELVWWRYILLDLFCPGSSLFGLPFKLRALLDKVVLVEGLWFSLFGIFLAIPFWLGAFPLRSQLLTLLGLPCMLLPVSPLLPLRFCLGILPF